MEGESIQEKYEREVVECPFCGVPIGLVRDGVIAIINPPLPVGDKCPNRRR